MQQINRALIFAHYDRDGVIDPHVQYAIKCYREVVKRLVVVSTSATALPESIAQYVDHFISRPNKGYDFCSWKEGIELLGDSQQFDEIICCNDSVYGPLFDLAPVLESSCLAGVDLWGMVHSVQGTKQRKARESSNHLQSWFFGMRRNLIHSPVFDSFWKSITPLDKKDDVINAYEIGMTEKFREAGFRIGAIYDSVDCSIKPNLSFLEIVPHLNWRNIRHSYRVIKKTRRRINNPSELAPIRLVELGVPFLKVNAFVVNHYGLDLDFIRQELERMAHRQEIDYDISLIDAHLMRVARGCS
ncbi:rhamnan synthesis F family protein [bacterium]|nr:rhamnan synthesis F family protein [bacterium]